MSKKTEGISKYGPLKQGTTRDDGYIFVYYYTSKGKLYERWMEPEEHRFWKVKKSLALAKDRAKGKGLPFNLDAEYLDSIYPKDNLCPALRTPLEWGDDNGRENSPSLDRIIPTKGYVRGNVQWLSRLANTIKTNATTAQICAVADYLRKKSTTDAAYQ